MRATRRKFSKTLAGAALAPWACSGPPSEPESPLVNDVHSQLNPTRVARVSSAATTEQLQELVAAAAAQDQAVSISGSRHAMGGQQFGEDTVLIDMRRTNRVLDFDAERGIVEAEAGIEWPNLIDFLVREQEGRSHAWGIAQKQTGADRLTLGGALAANAHGRGLRMRPFVGDVASFKLIDPAGEIVDCSRERNSEIFSLAAGGYGLFGVVSSIRLQLIPRVKLRRVVELGRVDDLMTALNQRIADGFVYGDFQFSIDDQSEDFLRAGVFSCYQPVGADTPMPEGQTTFSEENWNELLYYAHADKAQAFKQYSEFYLATSGQVYWSDTHQLSIYLDDYHQALDRRIDAPQRATEIISEIYVPRDRLADFMAEAAEEFRRNRVNVIYGTVRLIERDDESYLAWAKQPYACIIFNLHTVHTAAGIEHVSESFRRLIDMAIRRDGSYFLTYHRFARREQVEACYPQFPDFLRLKKEHDPEERFQSDWYRYYREMFA